MDEIFGECVTPASVLRHMEKAIAQLDPNYEAIRAEYSAASASASAPQHLAAKEHQLGCELLYLISAGLQFNAAVFHSPVQAQLLNAEFESIQQAYKMASVPAIAEARQKAAACAAGADPEPICEYYAYWETVGWKLAHFWGFLLGNQLLGHVIPGYIPDLLTAIRYQMMLEAYLNLRLDNLAQRSIL